MNVLKLLAEKHPRDENCIFCKIIDKKIPAKPIYEDESFICFYDIKPVMPIHVLLIPKLHISMLSEVIENNVNISLIKEYKNLLGEMFYLAPKIAEILNLKGFQLKLHNGASGGQEVFHIHLHIMGKQ